MNEFLIQISDNTSSTTESAVEKGSADNTGSKTESDAEKPTNNPANLSSQDVNQEFHGYVILY